MRLFGELELTCSQINSTVPLLKGYSVTTRACARNLKKLANFFKFRRDDFLPSQSWPSLLLSYCNCPPRLKLGFFLFSVAIFLFYRFYETFLKDVTELCRPGHGGRRSGSGRKRIYSSAVVRNQTWKRDMAEFGRTASFSRPGLQRSLRMRRWIPTRNRNLLEAST